MSIIRWSPAIICTVVTTGLVTTGAHDVIAITSPQKNDLCTEELRELAKSLDTVSLTHRKARFCCLFFR